MELIIVESPTKAKTLSRFLGKDYSVEATMGHIMDLPKSKLSIDVEHNFKPDYVLVPKRADTVKKIKDVAKKASHIYLASDPDREGEAIAHHVEKILRDRDIKIFGEKESKSRSISKYPNIPISRIVFHEITKEAVEEAIAHPRAIDKNLVDAQIARRVLDRLVGYKLSPLLWKKVRIGLSAGRVQSVAVRLIVDREKDIKAFKSEEYWEIYCEVKSQKFQESKTPIFKIQLIKIGGNKAIINNDKEAKLVVSDLEKSEYKVLDIKSKEVRKNPFPPFTTSTMSQSAARLLGWSAKKTMSVAQKLYEEGLITYHRTDSTNISLQAIDKVRQFIKAEYGNKYFPEKPRFYKTSSKVAQEAHEAIRPTNVELTNDKLQTTSNKFVNDLRKLYELIWKRFVACQMSPSMYDETTIDVTATHTSEVKDVHTSEVYVLRASGQVMKFDGWRKVIPLAKGDEQVLPIIEKDEELDLMIVLPEQKFTQPSPRYNEASLIKTLEKLGIGRPSTYAPIITTIQLRQYVEKSEGKFIPTSIGIAVNDFLVQNFPDEMDFTFTAKMEDDLDNIANGKVKWVKEISDFWKPFDKKLLEVEKKSKRVKIETEKLGKKCPECGEGHRPKGSSGPGGELVIRTGRFGKFISCSRFPDCKYTEKYMEKIDMKCPECKIGDVIIKKTRKGRVFYGCSRYPDCKFASWQKPKDNKSVNSATT
ncbi:DNA topoisomerase I [Candidatus Woesebacteria bacterium RIFCSPLOWO2_01_FULL_39_23]|uniref:DNA topoisomerase 1 n=1 Tax=Candidatus Woesebacteria bacterium RIFCSPHIGHO2_01_FULL_40_22 TaxID=1802499 RepID=A0A1F7YJ47_9BACT|nr:MAG: DNA topoisomerase I [Candidatus Woesebacteria bacterium RIFCSPHIGHO2_01_FULL_40_22]OGM38462.1 MAG: DNA topoisomerase I [Candidatus Woesebacteria bacterium RIFCSPHIGHO2_12_FULL_38_9]OGM63184.1 MAG: DNA topoisomerase I [Candidatus Woesebacteria bacterium RIFCSPLOWO2_01_FULL_39_23]